MSQWNVLSSRINQSNVSSFRMSQSNVISSCIAQKHKVVINLNKFYIVISSLLMALLALNVVAVYVVVTEVRIVISFIKGLIYLKEIQSSKKNDFL